MSGREAAGACIDDTGAGRELAGVSREEISDWYLLGENKGFVFPEGATSPVPLMSLGEQGREYAGDLLAQSREICDGRDDFWLLARDGATYRVHRERIFFRKAGHAGFGASGVEPGTCREIFVLRRTNEVVPLEELHSRPLANLLMHQELNRGGLVLIGGAPGSGKSTTAASMVVSRLKKFGGIAWTVECPVERVIAGRHGEGECLQTEVVEAGIPDALAAKLRCYPAGIRGILMLGEIREAESAAQLLRAANNGLLVITTMHCRTIIGGLERLARMAASAGEDSSLLLSESFRLMMMQTLRGGRVSVELLASSSPVSEVANRLRSGGFEKLSTQIQSQRNRFRMGGDLLSDKD